MAAIIYRHRLPHIRVDGAIYFVTWRVRNGQPELSKDERDCAAGALRHFDHSRYRLHAYVVMNDHVHVLVEPCPGFQLEKIVQSWKSYTTNILRRTGKRQSVVWQDEYLIASFVMTPNMNKNATIFSTILSDAGRTSVLIVGAGRLVSMKHDAPRRARRPAPLKLWGSRGAGLRARRVEEIPSASELLYSGGLGCGGRNVLLTG